MPLYPCAPVAKLYGFMSMLYEIDISLFGKKLLKDNPLSWYYDNCYNFTSATSEIFFIENIRKVYEKFVKYDKEKTYFEYDDRDIMLEICLCCLLKKSNSMNKNDGNEEIHYSIEFSFDKFPESFQIYFLSQLFVYNEVIYGQNKSILLNKNDLNPECKMYKVCECITNEIKNNMVDGFTDEKFTKSYYTQMRDKLFNIKQYRNMVENKDVLKCLNKIFPIEISNIIHDYGFIILDYNTFENKMIERLEERIKEYSRIKGI